MLDEGLARDRTETGDQVEDARGEAGLMGRLGEELGGEGVSSAGLRTTVQPAARAGPTLATIWWSG